MGLEGTAGVTQEPMITRAEFVGEMARLRDYLREQFPTKTELPEHYATKADLKDMEIRRMRWMASTALGGISIAVGLTAVLVRILA